MLVVLFLAARVRANTVTFYTVPGAQTGSGSNGNTPVRDVAAKVVFTTGLNTLLIEITNLESGITRMNQAIAAVDFLISGVSGATPTSAVLQTTDLNHGTAGTFTGRTTFDASVALGSVANRWSIASSGQLSGGLQLGAIHSAATNAKDLIVGPGSYSVNGISNGQMRNYNSNEYFQTNTNKDIAWLLTFAPSAGIDASDTVTSANMAFGLTFNATSIESLTLEPEPGTVAMMIGGLGLILVGGWPRALPRKSP